MKFVVLVNLCMLVSGFAVASEMRVWTSVDGREVEGEKISVTDTHVKLQLKNGRTFDIPLTRLVEEDRDFAQGIERLQKTEGWLEDFEQAKDESEATGHPILMLFTGSDWCPPCKRLERDVFSDQVFLDFATEHLILMKFDYPRRGNQSADIKRQNAQASNDYNISGYPTVLLANSEGRRLMLVNRSANDAEQFVNRLKQDYRDF